MPIATHEGAIENTAAQSAPVEEFDAFDAFFKRAQAAETPAEQEEDDEVETSDEGSNSEESDGGDASDLGAPELVEANDEDDSGDAEDDAATEDEGTQEAQQQPGKKPKSAKDDLIVKVKVDGKEHEVKVKDLKRLYGQETALNRKSQEVANQRKVVEETQAKQAVALTEMLKRAQARAEPYTKIDFLALAKNPDISAEELTALRTEAQRAFEDVNFYGQELERTFQTAQTNRVNKLRESAVECMKVLKDPKTGIEGWSQPLYDDLRGYAVSAGVPAGFINELVDPASWKLLHKAMMYDRGQKALSKTTKVVKTPKKIIKSSANPPQQLGAGARKGGLQEMNKLRQTGSVDDAADVFLSRFTK